MLITSAKAHSAPGLTHVNVTADVECCHVLDALSVPGMAFAAALGRLVPTTAWMPKLSLLTLGKNSQLLDVAIDGDLKTATFLVQRGYTKPLINRLLGITADVRRRILAQCRVPSRCVLICTSPFWADIAEAWPGPVIYYSLDFTYAYEGFSPKQVLALDTRLCRVASLVFPVSRRIRNYLVQRAGCDGSKITVLPNATLRENVQPKGMNGSPGPIPGDLIDFPRPMAGVIGNMADNLDWVLLQNAIEKTPALHWVFVGPVHSRIADGRQRKARQAVMTWGDRVRFTGARPYSDLQSYARSFDVAVLPYRRREPTYSGSATRFYEHLAAGRPMVATRNVAELQEKELFVHLVDTADGLSSELERLRSLQFTDGLEEARLRASRDETWDARARTMMSRLADWRSSSAPHCSVTPSACSIR